MTTSSNSANQGGRAYYDGDVDFDALARKDADFAAISQAGKERRRIDFQDPHVVQCALPQPLPDDIPARLTILSQTADKKPAEM